MMARAVLTGVCITPGTVVADRPVMTMMMMMMMMMMMICRALIYKHAVWICVHAANSMLIVIHLTGRVRYL